MAITKEKDVEKIEILKDGKIQVSEVTIFVEDGKIVGKSNDGEHRHVIKPGDDVSNEVSWVKALVEKINI